MCKAIIGIPGNAHGNIMVDAQFGAKLGPRQTLELVAIPGGVSLTAQDLNMPYALKGRNVLVTGGSRGLGAEICRKFAAEGCNIAINYANNEQPAQDLAKELQLDHSIKTTVIAGDAGKQADCRRCVETTISDFGGLDVIIANAGWTKFTDFADLEAMSEEEWDKCWATNVKGPKFLVSAALPTFKANSEGGVFIITSSIAAKSLGGSSMAYSVTKCAQVHLMKAMANTQGKALRINAVLPGLLLTDWGNMYGEERINMLKDRAALKKEVSQDVFVRALWLHH